MTNDTKNNPLIAGMVKAGAHFGYTKTRRHPSTAPLILATKNKADIINLEKASASLAKIQEFVKSLGESGKKILLVGTKPEAKKIIKDVAMALEMPYVTERWIGGLITNYPEVKKRITKYIDLMEKKSKGELEKYTKKERLMISREIAKLEKYFGGVVLLQKAPDAMLVIDSKKEHIAVTEAKKGGIPVISISNTDTNIKGIDYPLVANDGSSSSIAFLVNEIVKSYKQ